jgi:hypothetical protein
MQDTIIREFGGRLSFFTIRVFVLTENIVGWEAVINARLNSVETPDIEAA